MRESKGSFDRKREGEGGRKEESGRTCGERDRG
jgi:hypothetical protein